MLILVAGALSLTYLVPYFLNKDYQLNNEKKILTHSKYGQIANTLSIVLSGNLIVLFGELQKLFLQDIVSDITFSLISWIVRPIVVLFIIISLYITTYVSFINRKKWGIKYDEHDN